MRTVATCCDHTRGASTCARGATDAGASTATGSDLSPCGRAKAGFAGRAGCPHQAYLQCWPCNAMHLLRRRSKSSGCTCDTTLCPTFKQRA